VTEPIIRISFIFWVTVVVAALAALGIYKIHQANGSDIPNQPPKAMYVTKILYANVNGTTQHCGWARDPDGDELTVRWTARLGTVKKEGFKHPTKSRQWCTIYTGGKPGWDTVSFHVTDGIIKKPVTRRWSFCVYPDKGFGPPTEKPASCR